MAASPNATRRGRPGRDARGTLAIAAASGVASALAFGFHAIAGRVLAPGDYSGLASLLAALVAAAVPVGAAQLAVTRDTSDALRNDVAPGARRVVVRSLVACASLTAAGFLAAPAVAGALRIDDTRAVRLAALWLGIVATQAATKGVLIGLRDFGTVAGAVVLGAVSRIALLVVALPTGSLELAMLATVGGELASSVWLARGLVRHGVFERRRPDVRAHWPDAGRALVAQLALWLLAGTGVVVARRVLPEADLGLFAATATAAGAGLFLPQAVALVAFPRFATEPGVQVVARAVAVAAAVATAVAGTLLAVPDLAFRLLFGGTYTPSRPVLALLCLMTAALGCLTVLGQYLVSRRHGGVWLLWVGLVVSASSALTTSTPVALAAALAVPAAVTLVVVGAVVAATERRARRPAHGPERLDLDLAARLGEPARTELSVVIPSYQGGARLRPAVERTLAVCAEAGLDHEVIVVIDGSTDGSAHTVRDLGLRCRVVERPVNGGKGAALRTGFAQARGRLVGFIDGDGDIDPVALVAAHRLLARRPVWAVVASKHHPGATVAMSPARRVMSFGFRALTHWLFDLSVSDTQCGCKVFRREFLAATLPRTREDGFALDLELLAIGSRLGLREIAEVPVTLRREVVGTVSWRSAVRLATQTFALWRRLPQRTWSARTTAIPTPVTTDPFVAPVLP